VHLLASGETGALCSRLVGCVHTHPFTAITHTITPSSINTYTCTCMSAQQAKGFNHNGVSFLFLFFALRALHSGHQGGGCDEDSDGTPCHIAPLEKFTQHHCTLSCPLSCWVAVTPFLCHRPPPATPCQVFTRSSMAALALLSKHTQIP